VGAKEASKAQEVASGHYATAELVFLEGCRSERSVDASYEVPVACEVTCASVSDIARAPRLLGRLKERHPGVVAACEVLMADKEYDSGSFVAGLWDDPELRIKPVIPIRDCWQDGEARHLLSGHRNVVYDYHRGTSTATAPCLARGRSEQD